jgi:glutamine amidotransferase
VEISRAAGLRGWLATQILKIMMDVAVVDYDAGNLHSACKGLQVAGCNPRITAVPDEIYRADAVVLPGVGAFDPAVRQLRDRGLDRIVTEVVAGGKPFLGICVGMQLLCDRSEEGKEGGLGIVPGVVRRFRSEEHLTIPHMGWNQLELVQDSLPLWQEMNPSPWMYFVHSYYVAPTDSHWIAATVTHGSQTVTAAVAKDNIMAVQFHPEKSADSGLKLLANFLRFANKINDGRPSLIVI